MFFKCVKYDLMIFFNSQVVEFHWTVTSTAVHQRSNVHPAWPREEKVTKIPNILEPLCGEKKGTLVNIALATSN